MKIWHSGAQYSPLAVNGISSCVYSLAREQARLGHEVTLLVRLPPDAAALSFANETGVRFLHLPVGRLHCAADISSISRSSLPDLVHMHSVFDPQQWTLAKALDGRSIPFVITPNGGLSPHVLARSRWKKAIYSWLIERPRFRKAVGISVVTPKERTEVLFYVSGFSGPIPLIPNTLEPSSLEGFNWSAPATSKIVYLGRFDVVNKGIDIMLDLARKLRDIEFHLYGSDDQRTRATLAKLKQTCTPNVTFHTPVFGPEKAAVLAGSTLYLQMSRWESFGISVAEAMYLGLPCALATTMNISSLFEDYNLGLVVPADPQAASDLIRNALSDPQRLRAWSRKAKEFAASNFHPRVIALRVDDFYKESLEVSRSRRAYRREACTPLSGHSTSDLN